MLHNILIVDDEKFARSAVSYEVGKSGFQFGWVMEASSGEEALEMIEEHRPDILIADIRMEGITGIELIRQSRKIHPDMIAIIVCGYAEFTYAQQAIQLEVSSYLLKPLKPEEIHAALAKAIVEIKSRKKVIRLSVRNTLLEGHMHDRKLQEELELLLNGIQTGEVVSIPQLFPPDAKFFQVFQVHIRLALAEGEIPPRSEYDLMRYGIRNISEEMGCGYLLPFNSTREYRQITIIAGSSSVDWKSAGKQLLLLTQNLHQTITRSLGITVFIGVSSVQPALSASQMTQARQALDLRLSQNCPPKGCVFFYDDYQDISIKTVYFNDLKTFQQFLDNDSVEDALNIVHKIFDDVRKSPCLSIRLLYAEIICLLSRSCFRKGTSIFSFLGSECISGAVIDQFETMQQARDHLEGVIQTALNQWIINETAESTSNILHNIKRYIENNYTNAEISTSALAQQFCISLCYLSASYKKLFGITISKYIIALRVGYAEHLLSTTNMPVHLISESSGFNSLSYFMRVFKSHHNCTPAKFRERSSRHAVRGNK